MRERGAEQRAMDEQDFDRLYVEMERNEILMVTHKFNHMRQEDVFLAYYAIRKVSDIWEENKKYVPRKAAK